LVDFPPSSSLSPTRRSSDLVLLYQHRTCVKSVSDSDVLLDPAMEAIGVAANVVAVIDLSAKVGLALAHYARDVRSARDDIERLADRKSTRLNSSHVKSAYAV